MRPADQPASVAHVEAVRLGPQFGGGGARRPAGGRELAPGALRDGRGHRGPAPRRGEVQGALPHAHLGAPGRGCGRRGGDLLDERHHVGVVGVGLVELQHGELGAVAGRQALVAEDAAEFEDPGEAADHEPLQVQLGGDPQGRSRSPGSCGASRRAVRRPRPRWGAASASPPPTNPRRANSALMAATMALRISKAPPGRRRSPTGRRSAGGSGCRRRRCRATCRGRAGGPRPAGASPPPSPTARPAGSSSPSPVAPTQSPMDSAQKSS